MSRYLRRNQAGLYLGTFWCTGTTTDTLGNVYTAKAMDADASWGSAQPIDVAVQRWMTDGAVASTQGYENREITFQVKISADSSVALAVGEGALIQAVMGGMTLTWVPPEGPVAAPATVFDIWTGHLEQQFSIDDENRLTRAYTVTLTAKPWARSENLTVAAAVPTAGAGTTTVVDAGSSITGWSGTPTPSVVGGAIRQSKAVNSGSGLVNFTLTRTGSVTGLGATPYLAITTVTGGGFPQGDLSVSVDGRGCSKAAQSGSIGYYAIPAGVTSFTTLDIKTSYHPTKTATITFDVDNVSKTDTIPNISSHKMLTRTLPTGGAVKTSGSIQIASPSATVLGNTLVYTCPDTGSGYAPPLRRYRTSGGTVTADAAAVSGSHESFSTIVYSIPAGILQEATYVVMARFIFTGAGTATANFQSLNAASGLIENITGSVTATGAGGAWGILGAISLPGNARPSESQLPVLVELVPNGGATVTVDEVFLLDVTHGSFTMVTSPKSFTNLWLDSPDADLSDNRPHIYYGANADRSDAAQIPYAQIMSLGDHDLDPNGATVFTVTDNVNDAVVTASYFQRWHSNAAA